MNKTISQMREELSGKIRRLRKAMEDNAADENAREANIAFNTAETWYAAALNRKRWMQINYCRSQFEIAEKNFWKIVKGGEE